MAIGKTYPASTASPVPPYSSLVFAGVRLSRIFELLRCEAGSSGWPERQVPEADAAEEAGKLVQDLRALWKEASLEERRRLLTSMPDAVYVDARQTKSVVAVRPKPPFRPVFRVAASREGSGIRIINEPLDGSSVFLVETGRVELYLKRSLTGRLLAGSSGYPAGYRSADSNILSGTLSGGR